MKTASISEAKNRLSALIDGLDGGAVVITDRGRPVARLERISDQDAPGATVAALVRAGLASPAHQRLPPSFFEKPAMRLPEGTSLLASLLQEREQGR